MLKIGLYFGSFNPVHIGHMAIAGYMTEFAGLDQVWFVVSPHNPLKKKEMPAPFTAVYSIKVLSVNPSLSPSQYKGMLVQWPGGGGSGVVDLLRADFINVGMYDFQVGEDVGQAEAIFLWPDDLIVSMPEDMSPPKAFGRAMCGTRPKDAL